MAALCRTHAPQQQSLIENPDRPAQKQDCGASLCRCLLWIFLAQSGPLGAAFQPFLKSRLLPFKHATFDPCPLRFNYKLESSAVSQRHFRRSRTAAEME